MDQHYWGCHAVKVKTDANSGYFNLGLYKISSYLMTFLHQFGRYRFTILPSGVVSAGNLFQRKIDEIFKGLQNVFGIADDILIVSLMLMAGTMTDY